MESEEVLQPSSFSSKVRPSQVRVSCDEVSLGNARLPIMTPIRERSSAPVMPSSKARVPAWISR